MTDELRGYYDQSYPPSVWAPPLPPDPSLAVEITLGLTGPGGEAIVGGGPDGGVRIVVERDGTPVALADVRSVDWGDGHVHAPPDISAGYIAHIYTAAASDVAITVILDSGSSTSDSFDVIDEEPAGLESPEPEPEPEPEPAPEEEAG
jgi:hypothetical protein